jgi:hypothetical protein
MREHPCHQHRAGEHTDGCLSGPCGFCGTSLQATASGECRSCLRIVCEQCDGGYQPDLGPICQPCIPPAGPPQSARLDDADGVEVHRLCVFEFALSCGHHVTVALTGWYPVTVACCDRLGGTILRGDYVAFASAIDFVDIRSERYEPRPRGTQYAPTQLIGRRFRADAPGRASTGRFPARVGAAVSRDGSIAQGTLT